MPNYNRISTYNDFILYCLRKLGAPVINIEVDDTQIADRVTDALQFYLENNSESVQEFWWLYTCTETDVTNGYLSMPLDVIDVLDLMKPTGINTVPTLDGLDDPEYQFWNGYWQFGAGNANLVYYEITMQYISAIRSVLQAEVPFAYRNRERKIFPYQTIVAGNVVGIHGYKMIDPETETSIWDSAFLKEYCTALIGMQWGQNISKFGNIPSVGGITLNGDAILSKYMSEKERLEEKHKKENEYPPQMFWG